MSREHYKGLADAIAVVFDKEKYKFDLAAGLSEERLRWGMLHAIRVFRFPLYSYYKDSHIDTALRRIVGELLNKR